MFKDFCSDLSDSRETMLEQITLSVLECQLKMGDTFWQEILKYDFKEYILILFPFIKAKMNKIKQGRGLE